MRGVSCRAQSSVLIGFACSCTHCTLVVANRHILSMVSVKPKLHDTKHTAELQLCLVKWQKLTNCWLSKDVACPSWWRRGELLPRQPSDSLKTVWALT